MENTYLLSTDKLEELKSYAWEKNHDTDTFFIGGISIECFTSLLGYDLVKLQELKADNVSMDWDLVYGKPGTDEKHPNSYYLQGVVYIDNKIFNEKSYIADVDFLGLYTKTEEKPGTDWKNLLSNVLENALKETDVDSIVEFIDNNFADVSNKIRENCCENLEVDDIGECLKDDIARDWIEHNPDDAYDRAVENMYDSDVRDKVIDYINENLN